MPNLVYIYIYIYCHPQTDCFVVSQHKSVARHARCVKLGLKSDQLYIKLSIIPLSQQSTYVSLGIIRHYVVALVCLHFALLDTRGLTFYEELCIARVVVVNSLARVLNSPRWGVNIYIYIYIYICMCMCVCMCVCGVCVLFLS